MLPEKHDLYIQFLWQYKGTYGIINTRKKNEFGRSTIQGKKYTKKKLKLETPQFRLKSIDGFFCV